MKAESVSEVVKDLTVAVVAVVLAWHMLPVLRTANDTLASTDAAVKSIDASVRKMQATVNDLRGSIDKQLGLARTDVAGQVAVLNQNLDRQMTALRQEVLVPQLDAYRGTLNDNLTGFRSDLKPTLDNVAAMSFRFREASDIMLDCRGKPNCLPSMTLATMGTWRSVGGNIAKATPLFINQFDVMLRQFQQTNVQFTGIATDIHTVTSKYTAPAPWYKKVGNAAVGIGTTVLKYGVFD